MSDALPKQLQKSESALTSHSVRVLLIDDQDIVGAAVGRMLETESDIVFKFINDPTKAIQTALEFEPTVILQDLVMPDIDGLTLVKFLRANPKLVDVPLIVLSTKEEPETKAEAFALGANDYMVKLPDKLEIIARIRYHSKGYISLLERNEAFQALEESQEALKKELSQAADYVRSLLPETLPGPGIRTDWRFIPSSSLGGDSFGYHWLDDDNFAIYLLDVCDHGVGSALLSVSAMNVITNQSLPDTDFRDPARVLAGLNNTFQMEKQNNLYFTIWYGVYNKTTKKLAYSSGGHPAALLMAGTGETEVEPVQLRTNNLFVGGVPDMDFESAETVVETPARLFIYSDGVYELKKISDGAMWTFGEFTELMKQPVHTGENAMDRLIVEARALQGSDAFVDDFSMVEIIFE